MTDVFEKLNLKGHREIVVLQAPQSFEAELARLHGVNIHRSLDALPEIRFSLAFVTRQSEVDSVAPLVAARAKGDAIVWFAYPKGTSKKYKCDFNRDTGWDALKAADSTPCALSPSTRTGPRCGFGGWSTSSRGDVMPTLICC